MTGSPRRTTTTLLASTALALLVTASPARASTQEIDSSTSGTGNHFGSSVAVLGPTLVVGAPFEDGARGAVYVFARTADDTWVQKARLTASDRSPNDLLGWSVAISGTTIVAGANGDDVGAGAVYTFARSGAAGRTETAKLTASDRADRDGLGTAVDIDGDTIVAGAPATDDGVGYDADYGSVYTFAATGTSRTQTAELTASDNVIRGFTQAGSALGSSVAISGDTIVAGAPSDLFGNPSGARRGSAYTFARSEANRQQTAKLVVSGQTSGRVGESVDVLGNQIMTGDSQADDAFGAVWVFSRTGAATRNQVGKLTASSPRQNSGFGAQVSMSGQYVAVGAPAYTGARPQTGAGYVFRTTGAANRTETWFTGPTFGSGDQYGYSIVTDGDRVVGGAPYVDRDSPFVQDVGRVYSSRPDLFVTTSGAGTGTISSSPAGIDACSSSCSATYVLGQQVTLTAMPASGSSFAGWENYPGCSTSPTCVVTMDGSRQVVGGFRVGPPPPDTTPPVARITSGPAAGSTVTTSSVTFTFSADETSRFLCSYDGAAFTLCSAPGPGTSGGDTRTLAEGAHTLKLRAKDTAGNLSVVRARSFTVDLP